MNLALANDICRLTFCLKNVSAGMNCPGCKSPIGEGPFPVVGVLKAYDLDRESIEKDGQFSLRLASEFVPLARVTCPACGWGKCG